MASGALTSRELTKGYLERIHDLNPLLHAVIETNPQAVGIAAKRDAERKAGKIRGPLHGIPILVKDNIATDDTMETTAGSLALVGSRVPGDAPLVARLRSAGAVILGKANLSEWANFRGFAPLDFNGWSARGGKTRDPVPSELRSVWLELGLRGRARGKPLCRGRRHRNRRLDRLPGEQQPGVRAEADARSDLAERHHPHRAQPGHGRADGTDRDGSCDSPRRACGAHSGLSWATRCRTTTRSFSTRTASQGATIGVDQRYLTDAYAFPVNPNTLEAFNEGLDALESLGATLVPCDTGDIFQYAGDEFTVLLQEFKVDIENYLAGSDAHVDANAVGSDRVQQRSLRGRDAVLRPGALRDRELHQRRPHRSRVPGRASQLPDAVAGTGHRSGARIPASTPSSRRATRSRRSRPPSPGYPNIAIPCGFTAQGRPAGMWMYAGFLQEPKLLAYAYALEQALQPRTQPTYAGSLQPFPPNPGICAALPQTAVAGDYGKLEVSRVAAGRVMKHLRR